MAGLSVKMKIAKDISPQRHRVTEEIRKGNQKKAFSGVSVSLW
jgi:hypothetical protein